MTTLVSPKKYLGQHFLKDENIAKKIASSLKRKEDYKTIVEVGAGTGMLTQHILKESQALGIETYVVEIDKESIAFLKKKFPELSGRIIEKDFLEFSPALLLNSTLSPFAIIGNFPYNISSQILFKVLEYRNQIPEVVGMFQREVAQRLVSSPGNKTCGILSVLMQAYYKIEYLFTVHENVFYPPPKVKSAVLRFTRNNMQKLDCDEELFFKVVKTGFNQRRKILRNSLQQKFEIMSAKDAMAQGTRNLKSEILNKRAEQLSVSDFVKLTNMVGGS